MSPFHPGSIHFKATANGQRFLLAVLEDKDDVRQPLAHLFADLLVGGGSFIGVPITELRQT
ncbi:MAG: hypothetical protein DMG26_01260 [Acidobacteria bacterium]|nr:MAG: hypothetical protein DMG26_01260 [Acidobacteriota bacterium]